MVLALCLRIILLVSLLNFAGFGHADVPFRMPAKQDLERIRSAVISTNRGSFLIELYPKVAPVHVANFKYLADKGYYRDLRFDIYEPDYIIQGGSSPKSKDGGPGYWLPPEFSELHHEPGIVGMARRPDIMFNSERLSNGSQFHILLGDAPHMDRKYTVFGKVVDGFAVVKRLRKGDVIKDVKVYIRK